MMRDRHFMEDENELPFLVSEVRDSNPSTVQHDDYRNSKETLDNIINRMNMGLSEKMSLKDKLISFLNAKDCVNLTVDEFGYGEYLFIFTRKNEYISTTDEFEFTQDFIPDKRLFRECYTTHDYDNLINNPRFQNLIKSTGFEFIKCKGGYVTDYSMADDEFTMKDKTDVGVYLKAGTETRLYELDLEKMELSKDYFEL